jgi:hypothetical protein
VILFSADCALACFVRPPRRSVLTASLR